MKLYNVFLALIFAACLMFSGCSSLWKDNTESTRGAKAAVTQVAIQYLRLCILANKPTLNSYLMIGDYLRNKEITLEEYGDQVVAFARHWPIANHPAIDLTVLNVEVDESEGRVEFQRAPGTKTFPKIEVKLYWAGSSWAIVDDNIFGKRGLMETWGKLRTPSRN